MATEEQKVATSGEGLELQERAKVANPAELLQSSLGGLDKFGGFGSELSRSRQYDGKFSSSCTCKRD